MNIPRDPIMMMSFINTELRDKYSSLSELCKSHSVDEQDIRDRLRDAGYIYSEDTNQFVRK